MSDLGDGTGESLDDRVRALEAVLAQLLQERLADPGVRHENCLVNHGLLLSFQDQMADAGEDDYLDPIVERVGKLERKVFGD